MEGGWIPEELNKATRENETRQVACSDEVGEGGREREGEQTVKLKYRREKLMNVGGAILERGDRSATRIRGTIAGQTNIRCKDTCTSRPELFRLQHHFKSLAGHPFVNLIVRLHLS